MNYVAQLNAFDQWLEVNSLSPLAQLLWLRMTMLGNRAGWPEWVQVDNRRLMAMTGMAHEKNFTVVRDKLIEAGLVEFRKGHKGSPNKYKMLPLYSDLPVYPPVKTPVKEPVYPPVKTPAIYKPNETKPNVITPLPPDELSIFSDELKSAVEDWFAYKAEKRQPYRPTGRRNLLAEITNNAAKHGDASVADVIRQSMSSNYQGIVWDRLKSGKPSAGSEAVDNSWMKDYVGGGSG
jgi:hypothetical protein